MALQIITGTVPHWLFFWTERTTFKLKFIWSKLSFVYSSPSDCAPGGTIWHMTSFLPSLDILSAVDAAACFPRDESAMPSASLLLLRLALGSDSWAGSGQ